MRRRPPNVSAAVGRRQRHHQRHATGSAVSTPAVQHHLPRGRCAEQHRVARRAARVRQPAEFHAAHRHAAGARQLRALVRGAEDRLGARVRQHAECLDHARVHQPRVAAELRPRQLRTTSAACSAWRSIRTTPPIRACTSTTRARDTTLGLVDRVSQFRARGRRHLARSGHRDRAVQRR